MSGHKDVTGARHQTARHSSAWPRPGVLVVGQEPQLLDLLQLGFTYEGFDVHVATTDAAALRLGAARHPDLILVQAAIHQAGSATDALIHTLRTLRTEVGDCAVLVLGPAGQVNDDEAIVPAMAAQPMAAQPMAAQRWQRDADGYISQPFVFGELMACVRALLARRGKDIAGKLSFEDVVLDREGHLVTRGEQPIELTLREFELLELFLRHPEQVLSRSTILERIWGAGYTGSDNILDVYIHLLRAKLGDKPPRLICTVRGVGYVLRGTDAQARRVG